MMNPEIKNKARSKKNEEEKTEEVASVSAEAELGTPKAGFFRLPSSTGSQLFEETSDDEDTPLIVRVRRARMRKSGGHSGLHQEMAQELRTATTADLGVEQIRLADEVVVVAEKSGNLKDRYVKTLKYAATFFTLNATELTRRVDAAPCVAIVEARITAMEARLTTMEARLTTMEAGIAALGEKIPPHFVTEKSGKSPLSAIERKMEQVGTALTRLAEGRLPDIDGKKETEAVPKQATRRVDTEAPNAPATMDGQATTMKWQIVERRRKSKKASIEKQPARTTTVSGSKNSRKAPGRRTETVEKRGDKPPLPRTPRTSAVTITTKEGSAQSYVEVLAFARGSIPLAEVGVKALRMRKAMTGGVVLELTEDQKGEKAAALAAHLTRILDPSKVRVAVPFRAAEARVVGIDISVTKEEIRDTLAKEGGCKAEDIQLGKVRSDRNGLGSVWMRGPAGAVRILAQAGKVPGDRAREEDVHLQGGQGAPVLQVRWPGTPSHRMHRRKPEMPVLRGAQGTVGA
ncbi:uncharacterized protein LOC117151970 [Bombus impatiens]|uniref:Uncharacterized protein LOC117151970 n=1 Tax=Bombus impatiens TaxID=132113 RepID=A0A6P8L2J4_BOMIM|nr:uncharacterized protein LOC117151970 [Bombus impatiens]